jgi:deoxyribose-phosphate aldolase
MRKNTILDIVKFIDLTSLNGTDSDKNISELVEKANKGIGNNLPAAVCVYSNLTKSFQLINPCIRRTVVAGFFPESQATMEAKAFELKTINSLSIDEVDLVINRGKIIEGDFEYLQQEIKQAREILKTKTLKVILETGELTVEQIARASKIAINEKADFIKTSTGKSKLGVTKEAIKIMCSEIALSKIKCGIKISGGVRTIEEALGFQKIIFNQLGESWLDPNLFRIGASSLFDTIKKEIINHD